MRKPEWALVSVALVALLMMGFGCSSDNKSSTDPGGSTSGTHLIGAEIGAAAMTGGQFVALVEQIDASSVGADELDFYLNGEQLSPAFGSYGESAVYSKLNFGYTSGQTYTISVSGGGKNSSCSFTGPSFVFPTITAPADGSNFVLGNDISVGWSYDTNPPSSVWLRVIPNGSEESVIYERELSGSTTSHTIPGTVTAGHTEYTDLIITVDGGEALYPFDGNLAFTGSNVIAVLPGDAISIYPGQPTTYRVDLDPFSTTLDADGTSTSTLVAVVWDEAAYGYLTDGTVTFSVQPAGALSFEPNPVTMSGGSSEAQTMVRAGTTPGTATVTASCRGTDSDPLTYTLTEQWAVNVSTGTTPTVTWPDGVYMSGVVFWKAGGIDEQRVWSIATLTSPGIGSPLTYGTVPTNAQQIIPITGDPLPLVIGTTYRIAFVLDDLSTQTYTFTAQ